MVHIKKFTFIKGERRNVYFEVLVKEGESYLIRDATWVLEQQGQVISQGDCAIENNNTLVVTIEPPEIGDYLLTCSCGLGGQIIKEAVSISVLRKRG